MFPCQFRHPADRLIRDLDTTRAPRSGEQDGREYNFTTRDSFQQLVNENGFVEHAQFGGNFYGTSVEAVKNVAEKGRICVLDIEMEVCSHSSPPFFCMTTFRSDLPMLMYWKCVGIIGRQASEDNGFEREILVPIAAFCGRVGAEIERQRHRGRGQSQEEARSGGQGDGLFQTRRGA